MSLTFLFFLLFFSAGRLALAGGTLTAEFVEFEVKRALEWLQGFLFLFF